MNTKYQVLSQQHHKKSKLVLEILGSRVIFHDKARLILFALVNPYMIYEICLIFNIFTCDKMTKFRRMSHKLLRARGPFKL